MRRKLCFVALGAAILAGSASAQTVYGLSTRNQLVKWDAATPGTLNQAVFIGGMAANEAIIGIDFRPATGQLYALGSYANLYTLNTSSGQASLVAGMTNSVGGAPILLNGVEYGFDFNPVVDRIRITSDQGMNLRANPTTGVTIVDAGLNPGGFFISGSAYLNSDNDPGTGTTLYNIDYAGDRLTIQNPPNNGTQVAVGALGVDVSALVGFDILTVGTTNTAYAAFQSPGDTTSKFYTINLGTGAATLVGNIWNSQTNDSLAIRDIAVVPEPATLAVLGLGALAAMRRRRR